MDRVVTVKMIEAELAELDAQIAPLGLKRNRALRIAARRIGGFVEAAPGELELLRDAVRQLGGIARNVNQIARAANRTRAPDYRGFLEERTALGREIARLDARMQAVLDLAARRRDGLARLEAAAGDGAGGSEGADGRSGVGGMAGGRPQAVVKMIRQGGASDLRGVRAQMAYLSRQGEEPLQCQSASNWAPL